MVAGLAEGGGELLAAPADSSACMRSQISGTAARTRAATQIHNMVPLEQNEGMRSVAQLLAALSTLTSMRIS